MSRRTSVKETIAPPEKAFLVGVEWKSFPKGKYLSDAWPVEESMLELERLAETAGLDVVGQMTQKLEKPNPATFIGKGKADEIASMVRMLEADVVVFDDELAPRHQRELESIFSENTKVMDRTGLILDIFALHASTREGALQVELAQYAYRLPRLTQVWTQHALTRQAGGRAGGSSGGVGLRGPGQTRLEMDRFTIRHRMSQAKKELETVRAARARHRQQRRRSGLPTAAIVGYTNAGKSTLLNALSGADVYIADQLFATLDPTTRRITLPGGTVVLITDTVGFIQKLPTDLIASFRATLEEVLEADLLLHIIDVSHPHAQDQARAVYATLKEIDANGIPVINVLNKIDNLSDPDAACAALCDEENSVAISALKQQGLTSLLSKIEDVLESEMTLTSISVPFDRGDIVSLVHERGVILEQNHTGEGTEMTVRIPDYLRESLSAFITKG